MFSKYVMMVFLGAQHGGTPADVSQTFYPYRAECDYATSKVNAEVPGAIAFCFDVQVAGDRHESGFTDLQAGGADAAQPLAIQQ